MPNKLVENFLVVKNLTPEMSQNVTPKWRYFNEKWLVKKGQLDFSTKNVRCTLIVILLTTGDNLLTTSDLFQVTAPIDQNYPEIRPKIDQKLIENWPSRAMRFSDCQKTLNFRNFESSNVKYIHPRLVNRSFS